MMTKVLKVKRVSYGKESTPTEDREYRYGLSQVGNMNEWKDFGKDNGFTKVVFKENNGETWEQHIFLKGGDTMKTRCLLADEIEVNDDGAKPESCPATGCEGCEYLEIIKEG